MDSNLEKQELIAKCIRDMNSTKLNLVDVLERIIALCRDKKDWVYLIAVVQDDPESVKFTWNVLCDNIKYGADYDARVFILNNLQTIEKIMNRSKK